MTDNQNTVTHFEYAFFFLLRTQFLTEEGKLLEEPKSLRSDRRKQTVKQYGVPFDRDKRLFLSDVPAGEKLDHWAIHLQQAWQQLQERYAHHFESEQLAQEFCQNALLGVALLILDEGATVKEHSVHVALQADKEHQLLRFVKPQSDEFLFRIRQADSNKQAYLQKFVPVTHSGRAAPNNFFVHLSASEKPYLAPLVPGEFSPNPVFLVYGFAYGGGGEQWQSAVEDFITQTDSANRPSLLATTFVRLIMGQWQFRRMDQEAKQLRACLQQTHHYYRNYALQDEGSQLPCTRTRTLENQLQDMQTQTNEARLLMSRLGAALQTLDINGDNLAKRLEHIRQDAIQQHWQLHFHPNDREGKLQWHSEKYEHNQIPVDEVPILAHFQFNIDDLQDHLVYLTRKVEYLEGLQDQWRLFLANRRSLSGEHLNTLITLLIIGLAGGGTSLSNFTFPKSIFTIPIENQTVFFITIAIVLVPIVGHLLVWIGRKLRCLVRRVWRK